MRTAFLSLLVLASLACRSVPEPGGGPSPSSPPSSPGAAAELPRTIAAPPWFGKGPAEPGRRFFDGRGEAGTADEARQSARIDAMQQASQSVITEIDSRLQQATVQTRENESVDLRSRVEDDLKASSGSLLAGAKRDREEVLQGGKAYVAFVRISLPESEFAVNPDWFLARARDAAQRSDRARERVWLRSGLQAYPDDERLLKATASSLEDDGDLEGAMRQYQTLAQAHPNDLYGKRVVELAQRGAAGYERSNNYARAIQLLRTAQQWAPAESSTVNDLQADIDRLRRKQENPFGTACKRVLALAANGANADHFAVRTDTAQLRRAGKLEMLYSVKTDAAYQLWTILIEPEAISSFNVLESFNGVVQTTPRLTSFTLSPDSKEGRYWFVALAAREPFGFTNGDAFERDRLNDPAIDTPLLDRGTQAERLEQVLAEIERRVQGGKAFVSAFEFQVTP